MNYLKNIAIVGAGGRSGGAATKYLLEGGKHNITAITRPDSKNKIPDGVTVKAVDYDSNSALVDALKGHDALVITLSVMAAEEQQTNLIAAASEAGIPWILPNEFGSDNTHPGVGSLNINVRKKKYRQQIEDLGKSWIGVAPNLWYDYSLTSEWHPFGIDIDSRTASLYGKGEVKITTTTVAQTGRAVAAVLSLPVSGASPCLNDYKNKFVLVDSFFISQHDMLDSVQRVTGTSSSDWKVTYRPVDEAVRQGHERVANGDYMGLVDVLYGTNFTPGQGGDFSATKGTDNKALGLPQEDLDKVTKQAIEDAKST